jgi:hypothetical protein
MMRRSWRTATPLLQASRRPTGCGTRSPGCSRPRRPEPPSSVRGLSASIARTAGSRSGPRLATISPPRGRRERARASRPRGRLPRPRQARRRRRARDRSDRHRNPKRRRPLRSSPPDHHTRTAVAKFHDERDNLPMPAGQVEAARPSSVRSVSKAPVFRSSSMAPSSTAVSLQAAISRNSGPTRAHIDCLEGSRSIQLSYGGVPARIGRRASKSGRPDLNREPPPPKGGALPGCATPRQGKSRAMSEGAVRVGRPQQERRAGRQQDHSGQRHGSGS